MNVIVRNSDSLASKCKIVFRCHESSIVRRRGTSRFVISTKFKSQHLSCHISALDQSPINDIPCKGFGGTFAVKYSVKNSRIHLLNVLNCHLLKMFGLVWNLKCWKRRPLTIELLKTYIKQEWENIPLKLQLINSGSQKMDEYFPNSEWWQRKSWCNRAVIVTLSQNLLTC